MLQHHSSLDVNVSDAALSLVVAMFRPPAERVASTYKWVQATDGHCCSTRDFGWAGGWKTEQSIKRRILQGEALRATLGEFTGCMTHMVLGYPCMSRHSYDEPWRAVASAARRRIERFFFVGLTDQWRNSICLFNYLLTGERYVTWQQLKNCRPTPRRANVSAPDPSSLPIDTLDRALYRHASARFERDMARHGISDATCPVRGPEIVVGCAAILKPRSTVRLYM